MNDATDNIALMKEKMDGDFDAFMRWLDDAKRMMREADIQTRRAVRKLRKNLESAATAPR